MANRNCLALSKIRRYYFKESLPPGVFCIFLPHIDRLSAYEMPQKVVQNDRLALLLKLVYCTSHKKLFSLQKNQNVLTLPRVPDFCPISGNVYPFGAYVTGFRPHFSLKYPVYGYKYQK